jgi:hypothetical protein
VQQAETMDVKANTLLRAHQRGVSKPFKRAYEVTRKSGDASLEKWTSGLTNSGCKT